MDNDDWGKLLKLLQRELRKVGKFDIADIDNYEVEDRETNKALTKEMFIALHTELVTRSPQLLAYTLEGFGKYVKDGGPRPNRAVMLLEPERADPDAPDSPKSEAVPMPLGDEDVGYAIKFLEEFYFEIFKTKIPGAEK